MLKTVLLIIDRVVGAVLDRRQKKRESPREPVHADQTKRLAQADADKKLYEQFIDALPPQDDIRFLENHDFGGSFEDLEQLKRLPHEWRVPQREFHHDELQEALGDLLDAADDLLGLLMVNTFAIGTGSRLRYRVPSEWRDENRALFERVVEELNSKADSVVRAYDRLVRLCRRILVV